MTKHTMPLAPWQIPKQTDSERTAKSLLIDRAFMGGLNASDLHYMAQAILQINDENHELRERVRALEMVVQRLVQAEKARGSAL